jgi:hypothetical protein
MLPGTGPYRRWAAPAAASSTLHYFITVLFQQRAFRKRPKPTPERTS